MRRMTIVAVLLTAAALGGCVAAEKSPVPAGDTSRNALDWQGTYVGMLPCADCPGIRVRLELRDDGTFTRTFTYLDSAEPPAELEGSFGWDASGSRIMLGGDRAQQFLVGENVLIHLGSNGQRLSDDDPGAYRLEKTVNDPRIEGRRWRLVELNGRPVEPPADREGAYLELDAAQGRVSGNASCNGFFGRYELTSNNRLRFGPNLASTMMACPDLEREREFLDMLERVDNYSLGDGTLSLNRARMAPLARFRSVDDER